MTKFWKYIKVLLPVLVIAALIIFKKYYSDDLSDALAKISQTGEHTDYYKEFDLISGNSGARGTLLEFGATTCPVCRKMERVLEELKVKYSGKIDIRFINTTKPEGLAMGRNFGITAIPMQVLINDGGKVVFKNTGYISADDLSGKIDNLVLNSD
jgi:thiol-disulfide isomerase/thioredoxin